MIKPAIQKAPETMEKNIKDLRFTSATGLETRLKSSLLRPE